MTKWPETEVELARPIVAWLADLGWEVFQEVAIGGGARADIVARRGHVLWVVEVKRTLEAIHHAVHRPHEPSETLAAAGYQRWVDGAGDARILRSRPILGGPWTSEPLERPSSTCPPRQLEGLSLASS